MIKYLIALFVASVASSANASDIKGAWRITHGVVAPWADAPPVAAQFVGARAVFGETTVAAPSPLGCKSAAYEYTKTPPDGLFQGSLPTPAAAKARELGFAPGDVDGFSLSCDSGLWEFHFADEDTAIFALDNVFWSMSRAYGAFAPPNSPEGAVQAFLEYHFNHDYGFLEKNAKARGPWLSRGLSREIRVYFDRPFPVDEAPPINGDPFTDTQEFPTRFAVRKGSRAGRTARVPVEFADGYTRRRHEFVLLLERGRWRIDDLDYDYGGTFREAMKAPN